MSRTAFLGVLIFALCALIRIGLVDRHDLWADEFFSLAMATGHSLEHPADRADPALGDYVEAPEALPPAAYSRYLKHEVPPCGPERVVRAVFLSDANAPLYYLLLYGWTRVLGTGDASLRLFSVIWSLACFPLIWSIAKRLGGRDAAVATCILFAVSPFCVFYSKEGRMYSLFLLCSVSMAWLTLRMWDRGSGARRLALWVVVGVTGLLTHYFFIFLWLPVIFWLQLYPGKFPRRLSGAGAILTALLVLPWYIHIPEMLSQWRVTRGWPYVRPNGYHSIITMVLRIPWNFLSPNVFFEGSRFWPGIYAGVLLFLAVAAVPKFIRSTFSPPHSLLWFWLLGPWLGLMVFDLVLGTYISIIPRYAIAAMPAFLLFAGLSLASLKYWVRAGLIALIVLSCLVGVSRFYRYDFQQYSEAARLLASQVDQSDLIIVDSFPSCVVGLARYLEREHARVGFASWVRQLGRRRVPADLEALAAGRKRIILVRAQNLNEPAPEQSWLDENAKLVEKKKFRGLMLRYYTPLDSPTFFGSPPA